MDKEILKGRTREFALDVIKLVSTFPRTKSGDIIGHQLIKAATSVGANYRSACRARSHADFISKISIVEEEADESLYWLELTKGSNIIEGEKLESLIKEADELTSIFTASRKTAIRRKNCARDLDI